MMMTVRRVGGGLHGGGKGKIDGGGKKKHIFVINSRIIRPFVLTRLITSHCCNKYCCRYSVHTTQPS